MTTVEPKFGQLFNTEQAAAYLGMKPKRLRHLVTTGKIQVLRDGRLRFYAAWLDAWIVAHTTPEQPVRHRRSLHIELPKPTLHGVTGIDDLLPARRRLSRAS